MLIMCCLEAFIEEKTTVHANQPFVVLCGEMWGRSNLGLPHVLDNRKFIILCKFMELNIIMIANELFLSVMKIVD